MDYCPKRVFKEEKIKAEDKVVSLSDRAVSFIIKGGRDTKVGFKPQLGVSKNSFISTQKVPEGNTADSSELDWILTDHTTRTQVMPWEVSTDDGYANKKIRDKWLVKGVGIFSISGSKGKKMIPEEDWKSEVYKESRNGRSAAESLMFTLKHNFDYGKVMRRGIENARAEQLEKVIAYNFCKIISVREKNKKKELEKAA